MNQQVSIKEVIKAATQSMEADGISQAYIKQLSHTWNALTEYLSDNNSYFTRERGVLFLKEKYGISDETAFAHLRPIDKRRKRAVLILVYCTEGKSFYRKKDYWPCDFHDPFEPVFSSFLSERKSHDYALSTINRDIYTLNHFSKYLDISEINDFASITARTFQDFMKWMSASKNLPTLKSATATLRQLAWQSICIEKASLRRIIPRLSCKSDAGKRYRLFMISQILKQCLTL